jgi:cysteine desulfurase
VLALKETSLGDHVSFFELKTDKHLRYDHDENFKQLQSMKNSDSSLQILYHHLWVHNETGVISNLQDLSRFKSIPDLFIHVDAVQSPGKMLNWDDLAVGDIFTYSAHKFGALKGIGFSFFMKSLPFHPMITGGGQQSSRRSGTENPMGVWSIRLALEDLKKTNIAENFKFRSELEAFMESELSEIGKLPFKGLPHRISNTIYFSLNSLSSDMALALFDISGLEISAGSACSSGAAKDSVVMTKLGLIDQAKNGLRLSFGFTLAQDDVTYLKSQLKLVFQKLKKTL